MNAMDVVEAEKNAGLPGVDIVQHGPGEILIIATGPVTGASMRVAGLLRERGFGVTVVRSRWSFPVRAELLRLVTRHRVVVALEDAHDVKAGAEGGAGPGLPAGAELTQACAAAGISTPVRGIRLPRGFFEHREVLLTIAGLIGVDAALAGQGALAGQKGR
jgi:1-deoxy-D-xylulose-5-phosphate synthase